MKQIPKYAKGLKTERGPAYTMPDGWHKGYVSGMPDSYHKTEIRKAFKFVEGKANLVVLILNDEDKDRYALFKRIGDFEFGIHSNYLSAAAMEKCWRPNDQGSPLQNYMANVAMKVNIKTSGINHSVSKPHPILKGTLLLGADATRPGGTSNPGTPSVAAVVASLDAKCEISRLHPLVK